MADNDLTKTLIIVIIVFMICEILNPVRRFLRAVLPDDSNLTCDTFYFYFNTIYAPTIVIQSSIHFFIFSAFNRRFRDKLRTKFVDLHGWCWFGSSVAPVDVTTTTSTQPTSANKQQTKKSSSLARVVQGGSGGEQLASSSSRCPPPT